MTTVNRRNFLHSSGKTALGLGAGITILASSQSANGAMANEKLSLAMIGVGERGRQLAGGFLTRNDCEITHVCDVNSSNGTARSYEYTEKQRGKKVVFIQDYRDLLEETSVDAVVIATPDHWHAPMAIFACQAGKDVYVEKPQSINIWEGQKLKEAAKKYNRVVQVGTQSRSGEDLHTARRYIKDGKLGKVHLAKVFDQMGKNVNFILPPDTPAPAGFNWDIWNGPAPQRNYNSRIVNTGWHYFWDYSGGEIANNGIHQLDIARYLCGVDTPETISCSGGQFNQPGNANTPDTQVAIWQFPDMIMTYDLSMWTPYMLKTDSGIRNNDMHPYWPQNSMRVEIYGSKGMMYYARVGGGWQVYIRPQNRKPVVAAQSYARFPDPPHKENFVQCVKTRNWQTNANLDELHKSANLVHYANMSYRVGGQQLKINSKTEKIMNCEKADKFFSREEYRKPYAIPEEG